MDSGQRLRTERCLFTLFLGIVLLLAFRNAWSWPLRASIIVLLLGGLGLGLILVQLFIDFRGIFENFAESGTAILDSPPMEAGRWGNLEIWAWILGFYAGIYVVGFLSAALLFVFLYIKFYGGSTWTAVWSAFLTWGFLYGIFEKIMHVPWPRSLLSYLLVF